MGRSRGVIGIVGLIAFVVVDLFLVALAIQHTQAPPATAPPTGSSVTTSAPPNPGPSSKPSAGQSSASQPTEATDYLSVSADGALIRATRGDCQRGERPAVELSTDGGRTFTESKPARVAEVLRVQATGVDDLWLVGADQECQIGFYRTRDAGGSWERTPGSGQAWHLVPDEGQSAVHAPQGVVDTPCRPTSLSTTSGTRVAGLCLDGSVIGTDTDGQSWTPLGRLPGGVAIAFSSAGDGYALARKPGCRAASMVTTDGGAGWQQSACLRGREPRAIGVAATTVAAQVGDDLYLSTDAGSTWNLP